MLFRGILLAALVINAKGAGKIAGGVPATLDQFPFAASLSTNGGAGAEFAQACGGSVLSATAVLTAASCFYTGNTLDNVLWWRVRVGSAQSNSGGTVHFINRITVHPSFVPASQASDLAVVRPTVPFQLRPGVVQAANIAGAAYALSDRQDISAIGWGAISATSGNSPQLRAVQLFVADQSVCASRYAAIGVSVTEDMVCAGWLDVGVLAQCQGDVGSPLVVDGVVVGVLSRTQNCPDPWFPAINTRVAAHTQWIVSAALAP